MDISLRDFGLGKRRARGLFATQSAIFSASGTRVRSAVNSNSLGTFSLATNFKVPSEKWKQRESRQIVARPLQWSSLCGTLASENAVHAGISRRRSQFSLLRRLGCGGG